MERNFERAGNRDDYRPRFSGPGRQRRALALSISQPGDILSLTHHEKRLAWQDLHRQAIHHHGVPWFETIDRWVLPPKFTASQ